jgi:hypothetical protein
VLLFWDRGVFLIIHQSGTRLVTTLITPSLYRHLSSIFFSSSLLANDRPSLLTASFSIGCVIMALSFFSGSGGASHAKYFDIR